MVRHRVGLSSVIVVSAAVIALVVYALAVPGFSAHKADLNDGGVWVTRDAVGEFGRVNRPIEQLDGYVFAASSGAGTQQRIDVVQDGSAIIGHDLDDGTVEPIDPSGPTLVNASKGVISSAAGALAMAGGSLAALDGKGNLRAEIYSADSVTPALSVLGTGKPLAELGAGAVVTATQDGTVFAASAGGQLITLHPSATGFTTPTTDSLGNLSGTLQIAAVGDEPVVLASSGTRAELRLPGGQLVRINGADVTLQQSGPASDTVLLASETGLLSVPLAGGAATMISSGAAGAHPAAPVLLGGCEFAAWTGDPGRYGTNCSSGQMITHTLPGASSELAFRVNRAEIMLNDIANGNVWDPAQSNPQQIAHWKQIQRPKTRNNKKNKSRDNSNQSKALPPTLKPDDLGARPGRTTSLYVLDNDSDPAGRTLAVHSVTASVASQQSRLSIAPDGQTVDVALPADSGRSRMTFTYGVLGANNKEVRATVTVRSVPFTSPDHAPTRRHDFTPTTWKVPESGTVQIPVLGDWRDYKDGDDTVLSSASVADGHGQVSTTPDGDIVYTAPAQSGPQTVDYTVTDGLGKSVTKNVPISVQAPDASAIPATAEPDYAAGIVDAPITVAPLDNDLPGSDSLNPNASMSLVAKPIAPTHSTLTVDRSNNAITLTASQPGQYVLPYQVGYGSTTSAKSTVTFDVTRSTRSDGPICAPDSGVLRGQGSVTVDVLANDSDLNGDLLAVQSAQPVTEGNLHAAVVDGRYVRISADSQLASPTAGIVDYTVSDGVSAPVTGQIAVTQLPAVTNDTPITLPDFATVRAGQTVSIPVLDNDLSPAGDSLSLVKSAGAGSTVSGEYAVTPAGRGEAYASGRLVRYISPKTVKATTEVTVDYYVQNETGDSRQVGYANITVLPAPSKTDPNQPPQPQEVDARTTAGDTVRIKIPTSGVDPDGDSVTVTGVGSAQSLGRVVGFDATSITYQAYPFVGNGGTDTFDYTEVDSYGATATGTIRVAVVRPGDPQPPVAVDDTVTVAPGAQVQIDVLANDLVAAGDEAIIEPLARTNPVLPRGTRLVSPSGPLVIRAGSDPTKPVAVTYSLTDGLHESNPATVVVRSQVGANVPPVAFDQYSHAKPGATDVSINVLRSDYDPDSSRALTVVAPQGAPGGERTIRLLSHPQVVPYVISDSGGARAAADIYVPARGAGAPYAKPGKQITLLSPGPPKTIAISHYLISPSGRALRTTTAGSATITGSPSSALQVASAGDATHLRLKALGSYTGPAAVTFQVTDSRTLDAPGANEAFVTVPVQIGTPTPVLDCPSQSPIDVVEGGSALSVPISTLCHVWVPKGLSQSGVRYRFAWQAGDSIAGLALPSQPSSRLDLVASGSVRPGTGTVEVSVAGSSARAQTLSLQVIAAPAPTASPITLTGIKAGSSRTVDVRAYVHSDLRDAVVQILGQPSEPAGVNVRSRGSLITVAPTVKARDNFGFTYEVTDTSGSTGRQRAVTGRVQVSILNRPDAPANLSAGRTVKSDEVDLTWTAPNDHGAPIDGYTVQYNGGSQQCGVAPACAVRSLHNGTPYRFTVTARNVVGPSLMSNEASATPDKVPDGVSGFVASNPQDGSLSLTWHPDVATTYSTVTSYLLQWTSQTGHPGTKTLTGASQSRYLVTGLDNDSVYQFTISAINAQGPSLPATAAGLRESAGIPTPKPPAPVTSIMQDTASNEDVVSLSGYLVDPNGPGPVTYTVRRTGGSTGAITLNCIDDHKPACTDPNVQLDGTTYSYSVSAQNAAAGARYATGFGPASSVEAAFTPDAIKQVVLTATGSDGAATLSFTAPASHGKISTILCTVGPSGAPCSGTTATVGWNESTSGQSDTRSITGLQNGSPTFVTLQDCNGSSGVSQTGSSCDSAANSNSVTPYGPIGNSSVSVSHSGTVISWTVMVNPNGRPASVNIFTSHGYNQSFTTGTETSSNPWTNSSSEDVGYNYKDTVTVTVSDSTRASPLSASNSDTSSPPPPPPAPSIQASDGGLSPSPQPGTCSGSCHYLSFSVSNFPSNYYSWQCYEAGQSTPYFSSRSSSLHITQSPQSFSSDIYCDDTNMNVKIVVNGTSSNYVHL